MPAPTIYTPPAFRRYFALTDDPNAAAGGSNLETIQNDTAHFTGGDIPDVTATWPVTTATHDFNPNKISRANEVTGFRAQRPDIPFKVSPQVTFSVDAYRYALEKVLKNVMGSEGTIGGSSPGPYTHPLSPIGFTGGSSQVQPALMLQIVRDAINHKMTGVVFESVDVTFPFDGAGTVACEGHPLYTKQIAASVDLPTGIGVEPDAEPMVLRDAVVVFDDGATTAISISQFTFGFKNNSTYERQVAGRCVEENTVGVDSHVRKLWFPYYHKLSARQTVTFGLNFLDTQEAQEVAMQWGTIQKIEVTVADPIDTGNQVVFTLYATEVNGGGVDALTATGDQTSAFTGNAYESTSDGTDVLVTVTNTTNSAI